MVRIAALRSALNWSQLRLADEIAVSQGAVSRMESGQPERRSVSLLLDRLALDHGRPDLTAENFMPPEPVEAAE